MCVRRGLHVQVVEDGTTDVAAMRATIAEAKAVLDKPSLIIVRTTIGFGSPNKGGTASAHGSPLGADETQLVREKFDWQHKPFEVPLLPCTGLCLISRPPTKH